MNKLLFILLFISTLQAQTTGGASLETVKAARDSERPNRIFSLVALISATAAIIAVAVDNGAKVESSTAH